MRGALLSTGQSLPFPGSFKQLETGEAPVASLLCAADRQAQDRVRELLAALLVAVVTAGVTVGARPPAGPRE